MKKYFLLTVAAIGMIVGCSKSNQSSSEWIDDSTPQAVQFNIDAPSLVVTKTKGVGGVDEWNKDTLYIFGYETADPSQVLIPNVAVIAPDAGTEGLLDVKQETTGEYGTPNEQGQNTQLEPYYYLKNVAYSFFGFYVDDAADGTQLTIDDNGLATIPVVINGTQDIMAAKANPIIDVAGKNVPVDMAYSAYAARRGVHPTLTFNHLLTRFNFYIVSGSESGDTTYVNNITIDSETKATLQVSPEVALIPNDANQPVEFELMQRPDAQSTDKNLVPLVRKLPYSESTHNYKPADVIAKPEAKIGESIIVMPGAASHTIIVSTSLKGSNQDIEDNKILLEASKIKDKDGENAGLTAFEPGYQYDIILTIYGPEEVKITAVLSKWKDGGYSVIDPDDIGLEFQIDTAYAVTDKKSWESLPEDYLNKFDGGWDVHKDNLLNGEDKLPWLAVEFTPTNKIEGKATNIDTGYVKEIDYAATEEGKTYSLLTLCAKELGVESMAGRWIVEINDMVSEIIEINE